MTESPLPAPSRRLTGAVVVVVLSTLLEVAGLALVVWGAAEWDWRLGLVVGGLVLLLVGVALDPPRSRAPE